MTLTTRVLLGMVLGLAAGILLNSLGVASHPNSFLQIYLVSGLFDTVGRIFIISLQLLVVPLVFVSLVCGTCSLGEENHRLGPMAAKTLVLYLITTCIAISIALLAAILIQPGMEADLGTHSEFTLTEAPSLKEVIINIFPANPVQAMAEGNMLQIIVFSILLGIAISKSGEPGRRISAIFNDLNEIIMKMVTILIELAPYGVFCLLAKLFATLGFDLILDLFKYFMTVVLVLLIHGLGVYPLMLRLLGKLNPIIFLRKLRPVMLFAFSTSSSGATMPVTLRTVEKRLGVKNAVASFTIPLGATINMDGTAIMQGVATVFIAQAYNIDIGLNGYLMVILTATLASIGTAGVPGVGIIMLTMVLGQVGLPVEGIALIIGVDRLLDMMRTIVNVTGDSAVSCIVAKSENEFDEDIYLDPNAGEIRPSD